MVQSPDGKSLLIATNGYAKPAIAVVDLDHESSGAWWNSITPGSDSRGIRTASALSRGAGNNTIHEMQWADGKLTRGVDLVLGRPMDRPLEEAGRTKPVSPGLIGGLAVSPDGQRLFAVNVLGRNVSAVDVKTGHIQRTIELHGRAIYLHRLAMARRSSSRSGAAGRW